MSDATVASAGTGVGSGEGDGSGAATTMLNAPRKRLWMVTIAVVGRPFVSGSLNANSKRRSTSRIDRQKNSG